ncbi:TrbI/VirB10 family protein [Pseudomonas sp. Q1-7]|uniref:TrbI/VirB10 family protein n=1 Tax=Pseudomonas sp. Q1-7 TaxID=3020843 RepID=UPI0022FFD6B7|nr:TrbI/VirB10 family protein [Pseudomonas sp. Q1-7]
MQKPNDAEAPVDAGAVPESTLARGAFDLRQKRSGQSGTWKMVLAILAGGLLFIALFVGGFMVIFSSAPKSDAVDEEKAFADPALQRKETDDDSYEQMLKKKRLQMQKEADEQEKARQELLASQKVAAPPPSDAGRERAQPAQRPRNAARGSSSSKGEPLTPAERRLSGGVVMTVAAGEQSGGRAKPAAEEEEDRATNGSDRSELNNLGGTRFASTKAKLAPDGTYLLAHNTYARCALYTEIITDNPGLIECRLTDPLYSANGRTVLAEAGARLFGEQRTAVKQGQQRVFTAWTEMEANNGSDRPVRVRLDSLGAGPMGASGTQAWIDNHWAERTGGALMLSLFQDVMAGISNATQTSSKDGYTVNNTERNVEGLGEKVLDSTINIPPTAYILPGTVMTVIVARDIDFSTVYENH